MTRVAWATAFAIVTACGSSPPVQFYTLDAVRPATAPVRAPAAPLQVLAVHIPATLDRQEIVREAADSRLAISDEHRWGAPLADMIRRVLTQDLAARFPAGTVVFPDEPAPDSLRELVVDVLRFDRDPAGVVTLDGSWSVVAAGSTSPILSRHVLLTDASGPQTYAGQVQSMNRILAQFADRIAGELGGIAVSAGARGVGHSPGGPP
jgi:uncharacterized lipoprotein YmbA